MGKAIINKRIGDFLILGPTLVRGNQVLEAIHALYYLPHNFKMVFTGAAPVDLAFYGEVVSLIERDALADRVHFTNNALNSDVVIVPAHLKEEKSRRIVKGDSAEALASAILNVARKAY